MDFRFGIKMCLLALILMLPLQFEHCVLPLPKRKRIGPFKPEFTKLLLYFWDTAAKYIRSGICEKKSKINVQFALCPFQWTSIPASKK